ncbi:MAG: DUF4175 family protein, partial [Alphaproteobacteria bacterium]|nr:DUF4175 family protein [Alphaproteobacteria bacterium]
MDSDPFAPEALPAKPRRLLGMAWLVLAWERAAPALAPLVWLGIAFLALALSDLLPVLPAWAHVAVLGGFGAVAAAAGVRLIRRLRFPRAGDARRRLEADSVLPHRPFSALVDRPATAVDATTPQLWRRHRADARSALSRIRLDGPRRGPLWLAPRAALLCLLLVAASDARDDAAARLARAVDPDLNVAAGGLPAALDLWVTPPAYTGVPPVFASAAQPAAPAAAAQRQGAPGQSRSGAGTGLLAGDQPIMGLTPAGKLVVPQGSVITAQVTGSRSAPSFLLDGAAQAFTASEAGAWKVERVLEFGQRLEVRQGSRVLGSWPLQVVADVPPVATFVRNPAPAARGALRIDAEATDDYGVE